VHGGTGKTASCIDGTLVRVQSGKSGQQRWVDVEQAHV
jgi:hypothetical protein